MNESLAVAWTDLKSAMLYFDRVICPNPDCFVRAYSDRVHYAKLLEEINPTGVPITEEPYGLMIHSNCMSNDDELEAALPPGIVLERPIQFPMSGPGLREWIASRSASLSKFFSGEVSLESFRRVRQSIPYKQAPAFVSPVNVLLGDTANYGRLVLTVGNLSLIDCHTLPWDTLFALRNDKVALQRLRRVFLLGLEQHDHKSMLQFDQEIENAVNEHQAVAAELGLATTETSLNFIFRDGTELCTMFDALHKSLQIEPPLIARWQGRKPSSLNPQPLFVHLWRREITWEVDVDRNPVAIYLWQRRPEPLI